MKYVCMVIGCIPWPILLGIFYSDASHELKLLSLCFQLIGAASGAILTKLDRMVV